MCRNIKTLFNFEVPATEEEITAASLQFVRKISGFTKPSQVNEGVYDQAVADVSKAAQKLLASLETNSKPRNREEEARKAHERAVKKFGV